MKKIFFFLIFSMISSPLFATQVTVKVTNIDPTKNGVLYLVVCQESGFKSKKAAKECVATRSQHVNKNQKDYTFTFMDIPEDKYAINGFYDANNNGKLETNFIGIPTEYTFFPVELHGPPFFSKVNVTIKGKKQTVKLITQKF